MEITVCCQCREEHDEDSSFKKMRVKGKGIIKREEHESERIRNTIYLFKKGKNKL
jgi:hypothetical protein